MGLKEKHILTLNGELRPISPPYLNTILELLLNTLVLLNASTDASPASDIADALQYDHEVPREVSLQVMSWFGQLTQTADCASQPLLWRVDVDNVVRQLGIGVLSTYRVRVISFFYNSIAFLRKLYRAYRSRSLTY